MNIIKSTIRHLTIAVALVIVAFAVGWWWAEFDTQRARLALEKANIANAKAKISNVASEQKPPPAPRKNTCPLRSIAPSDDAVILFYSDDTPNCSHPPHIDPAWHAALVRQLHRYRRYLNDTLLIVVLSFTVDRGGHVLNPEVVTLADLRGTDPRYSGHRELEDQAISMIDRPLPPFPDSMTDAKLDLIVRMIFGQSTPPDIPEPSGPAFPCNNPPLRCL
jgi:hypothetical protein